MASFPRSTKIKLKKRRSYTDSSRRWLLRQLNDPYVKQAQVLGYRSRAAFKLAEIDDKYHILKPGHVIVDLGAAPGGWSQVAATRVKPHGHVIGVDLVPILPLPGATFLTLDFLTPVINQHLTPLCQKGVDVVLSDMAAPACGIAKVDHMRIIALAEAAFEFAILRLKPNGAFVAKVLRGGTENTLLARLKRVFSKVRHFKPLASRSDSAEMYVIALGFHPVTALFQSEKQGETH